jgi:N-formylglutamate deformylase
MELFVLHEPRGVEVSIVANLPHSGVFVPEAIAAQLTPEHLKALPNTDWHLDKLYRSLPNLGITMLQATHNRYVVDLNREVKDPIFGDFWSSAIPERTAFGQPIYQTNPSQQALDERIQNYYLPYHNKLTEILQTKIRKFGKVYLLDLHSFLGLITDEICLGDRNGETCSEFLISTVEKSFLASRYQVVKNKVFTGGYITKHYGEMPDVEALQIEVRYPVYLQEDQLEKPQPPEWTVPKFYSAKQQFDEIFAAIVHTLCPEN